MSSLSTVGPIGMKQDPKISDMQLHRRVRRGLSGRIARRARGPAAGEAALGAHHGHRSELGRSRVDGAQLGYAGLGEQQSGACGREHPSHGIVRSGGPARDEDAFVRRRGQWALASRAAAATSCVRTTRRRARSIHELTLPANQSGIPMSYEVNGRQFVVVAVGAKGQPGELVALSLP